MKQSGIFIVPVQTKLSSFFLRYNRYLLYRRILETIAVLMALVLTFFLSLYFVESRFLLTDSERLTLVGLGFLTALVVILFQLKKYLEETEIQRAALTIEQSSSENFSNELITAVGFIDDDSAALEYGYSSELVDACIDSATSRVGRVSLKEVISLKRVSMLLLTALLTALPYLTLYYKHPFEVSHLQRAYLFLLKGEGTDPLNFFLEPGDLTVPSGTALDFLIAVPDKVSTFPVLECVYSNGETRIFPLLVDRDSAKLDRDSAKGREGSAVLGNGTCSPSQATFSASIADVREGFSYRFAFGPLRTRSFNVTVVDPPTLVSGHLTYEYPAYTRLEKEKQKENLLHIRALEGTTVTWSLDYSQPLTSAFIILNKSQSSNLDKTKGKSSDRSQTVSGLVKGKTVCFSFIPEDYSTYSIEAIGENGFSDPLHHKYRIDIFKDAVPRTFVLDPACDLSVEVEDVTTVFPVKVFSEDDYGLTGGRLVYTLKQRYEYTFSEATFFVPFKLPKELSQLTTSVPLDLRESILQPGDSISYHFEAFDGYEPKRSGNSRTYHIRIPFKTDDFEELLEEHQQKIASVDDVLQEQKEIDRRLDDVVKRVASNKDMKWRDKQEMEKILEKQKKLRKEAQEVTAGLEKTISKIEKKNLLSESALQKLQQVHELMAEVSTDRMKNMIQKMQQMMSQANFDKKHMDSVMKGFDEEKYTKELDKVLGNLKKLKAQQELSKAVEDTKQLIQEQENLLQKTMSKALDKESISSLETPQTDLAKKAEKNAKSLSKAADSLKEFFPESSEQVGKEASKNNGDEGPSKDMKKAAEAMASNKQSEAMEEQQKALSKLRSSLEELNQIKGKMDKKQASINIQAVTALLYKAVELSWLSGAIAPKQMPLDVLSKMPSTSALRRDECRRMALESDRVWRRLVSFEKDFNSIFSDELMFKGSYLTAISQLIEEMARGRHEFEQVGYFSGIELVRKNGDSFNFLILQLLQLTEKMKDQASQSSQQDFMEQMEDMIQRQQQLNEMCNRQGQRPKASPMMQQMFDQMAREQEMIQKSMEELARRYEEGMKLDERLQKVAREMKEVADRLSKFDGGEETQEKQKKIVTRMLDYSRSMHNQDFSKERKSKDGVYEPARVPLKTPEVFEIKKEIFKNMTGDSYPPQFSDYVDKYMDSIGNR